MTVMAPLARRTRWLGGTFRSTTHRSDDTVRTERGSLRAPSRFSCPAGASAFSGFGAPHGGKQTEHPAQAGRTRARGGTAMRIRTTTIAVAAGVLAGSMLFSQAAGARTTRPRTVHGTYASPVIGAAANGLAGCSQTDGFGCVVFATRATERHATISIKDQSGQPVYAQYGWNKQTPGSAGPGSFI